MTRRRTCSAPTASRGQPRPKIGFVSLGCPKALTDSELILTQLRAEGYATSKTYDGADLVIVNTCGFIDDAVQGEPRHDRRGAGRERQGDRHRLPRREGGRRRRQPGAPDAPERARRDRPARDAGGDGRGAPRTCRSRTTRSSTCVPPQGIKLTPRHYAYLKISEGCNHRCTFCIIPSMRGDLVVAADRRRARRGASALFEAGVKELLVVSQDTSAYGVDVEVPHRLLGRPAGARRACSTCASSSASSPSRSAPGCGCTTSTRIRTSTRSCR